MLDTSALEKSVAEARGELADLINALTSALKVVAVRIT
jgi:hypothetical protein